MNSKSKSIQNDEDSCLGVLSLHTSAWIIAIVQLSYSSVSLIYLIIQTNNVSFNSFLDMMEYQDFFLNFIGIVAAMVLAFGNFM